MFSAVKTISFGVSQLQMANVAFRELVIDEGIIQTDYFVYERELISLPEYILILLILYPY